MNDVTINGTTYEFVEADRDYRIVKAKTGLQDYRVFHKDRPLGSTRLLDLARRMIRIDEYGE